MTRYIDVDALRDALGITADTEYSCKGCQYNTGNWSICNAQLAPDFAYVCSQIDDAPTIDAVPVIRCKDCYFYGTFQRKHYCTKYDHTIKQDGFCAWAEPKEKDNDRTDL